MLDGIAALGANVVLAHVRPFGDALYPSALYPFSHLCTGTQGQDPGFDPLALLVEAAHARGLQLEAWINPYRLQAGGSPAALAATNPASLHPGWVREAEGGLYLDRPTPPCGSTSRTAWPSCAKTMTWTASILTITSTPRPTRPSTPPTTRPTVPERPTRCRWTTGGGATSTHWSPCAANRAGVRRAVRHCAAGRPRAQLQRAVQRRRALAGRRHGRLPDAAAVLGAGTTRKTATAATRWGRWRRAGWRWSARRARRCTSAWGPTASAKATAATAAAPAARWQTGRALAAQAAALADLGGEGVGLYRYDSLLQTPSGRPWPPRNAPPCRRSSRGKRLRGNIETAALRYNKPL